MASSGAAYLDKRVIPANLDWRAYDIEPEHCKVVPAVDYSQAVIDAFYAGDETKGAYWPWDKANAQGLRFRPAELTIYAGINGHRKSLLTSQIALHLMRQGERVLLMSFEMPVVKTLQRMLRQAAGCAEPAIAYIKAWHHGWSVGRLWFYNHYGLCAPRQAIAVGRYGTTEHKVQHLFIDSLMKVVASVDDYNGQKAFVDGLCRFAMESGIHVHLVAHARKGKNESDGIDKWDVKGAGEITDLAHNVILVSKKQKPTDGEPTQWVESAKQRDGAFEGMLGLYFNDQSLAFGEKSGGHWPVIQIERE